MERPFPKQNRYYLTHSKQGYNYISNFQPIFYLILADFRCMQKKIRPKAEKNRWGPIFVLHTSSYMGSTNGGVLGGCTQKKCFGPHLNSIKSKVVDNVRNYRSVQFQPKLMTHSQINGLKSIFLKNLSFPGKTGFVTFLHL